MTPAHATASAPLRVRRFCEYQNALRSILQRFRLTIVRIGRGRPIPYSYWGTSEAGLHGSRLYLRGDTPVHSVLHESCHFICMDARRRRCLKRNAGGDAEEENAVNLLSLILAEHIPGYGADGLLRDMDRWGYRFVLGSARAWFTMDSSSPRLWLLEHRLINCSGQPTFKLRGP